MTMEVAQALEERLKAEGIDPNQYYSSIAHSDAADKRTRAVEL